jgi:hypothetical protein
MALKSSYRLKGCTPKYVNELARKQFYNGIDISNIIDGKSNEIVLNFSINDCIKLILYYGDLYDVFNRYNNDYHNSIKFIRDLNLNSNDNNENSNDNDNRILFHREIAYLYIKELIQLKIETRINQILNFEEIVKNHNIDKSCSICLELVTSSNDDNWFVTKCNHLFHKKCISKWTRNTCPLCRKRYYK